MNMSSTIEQGYVVRLDFFFSVIANVKVSVLMSNILLLKQASDEL